MKRFFTSLPGVVSVIGLLALIISSLVAPPGSGVTAANEIVQIAVTFIVLASALYIILSKQYPDDAQKWAFGVIGLIIGFWLPIR